MNIGKYTKVVCSSSIEYIESNQNFSETKLNMLKAYPNLRGMRLIIDDPHMIEYILKATRNIEKLSLSNVGIFCDCLTQIGLSSFEEAASLFFQSLPRLQTLQISVDYEELKRDFSNLLNGLALLTLNLISFRMMT